MSKKYTLACIGLAVLVFPALLNSHLALAWHGIAQAALAVLVVLLALRLLRPPTAGT